MTTSVRIINNGPQPIEVQRLKMNSLGQWEPAGEIETIGMDAVSKDVLLYRDVRLQVKEVL